MPALSASSPRTTRAHQAISPALAQDPTELWNSEHLQAAELLAAFLQKQEPNCLIRNSCSAIACPAAAWTGVQRAAPRAPEPALAPQKSKHVAAVEQKIGAIMTGGVPCALSLPKVDW